MADPGCFRLGVSTYCMERLKEIRPRFEGMHIPQWRIQDFPDEGGANSPGCSTYDFAKISQKLHEIEKIWTPSGRASLAPLLDPPMFLALSILTYFNILHEQSTETDKDSTRHSNLVLFYH